MREGCTGLLVFDGRSVASLTRQSPLQHADGTCTGCGTALPVSEPILVKFHRCYYCGRHNPLGPVWKLRTAPAIIAAAIGIIAIWWTQLAS